MGSRKNRLVFHGGNRSRPALTLHGEIYLTVSLVSFYSKPVIRRAGPGIFLAKNLMDTFYP